MVPVLRDHFVVLNNRLLMLALNVSLSALMSLSTLQLHYGCYGHCSLHGRHSRTVVTCTKVRP